MALEILAQTAVMFFLSKTIDGALESIGSDAYKAGFERIKGFLTYKFAGKPELEQAAENPKAFEKLVENTASEEESFKQELEKLVNQLQEAVKTAPPGSISYNNVGYVANQDIKSPSGEAMISGGDAVRGTQNKVGGNQDYFRQQEDK